MGNYNRWRRIATLNSSSPVQEKIMTTNITLLTFRPRVKGMLKGIRHRRAVRAE